MAWEVNIFSGLVHTRPVTEQKSAGSGVIANALTQKLAVGLYQLLVVTGCCFVAMSVQQAQHINEQYLVQYSTDSTNKRGQETNKYCCHSNPCRGVGTYAYSLQATYVGIQGYVGNMVCATKGV